MNPIEELAKALLEEGHCAKDRTDYDLHESILTMGTDCTIAQLREVLCRLELENEQAN